MKALKVTGIIVCLLLFAIFAAGTYIRFALPDTGPAPKLAIARTAARVERGRYLANHVAVCMDCHSTRDWQAFAGPMVPGNQGGGGEEFNREMGFPGTFHAPNITPYALGSWTDGEIFRAITTGVNREGKALFPVMAYHRFGRMDSSDVHSIIAYLRTLPPVKNSPPPSKADFPVNILINTMPGPAAFAPLPVETDRIAYGRYLINAAGCVDCHSKTDKGKVIGGTEFGGGMEFRQPAGVVTSPNITFDPETGIGHWTKTQFVRRFKAYADSGYEARRLGPGDWNTAMPWTMYAGMRDADLEAIYDYLQSLQPIRNATTRFVAHKKN